MGLTIRGGNGPVRVGNHHQRRWDDRRNLVSEFPQLMLPR